MTAPTSPNVIDEIAAERRRQIEVEGWTSEHDDAHQDRSLAAAALAYVQHVVQRAWTLALPDNRYTEEPAPDVWPWDEQWWKPKDPRRDLLRAAALIVAEIERLDRRSGERQ